MTCSYPYPFKAGQTGTLTVVLHMQLFGRCRGPMERGALADAVRCRCDPYSTDQVLGSVIVVNV